MIGINKKFNHIISSCIFKRAVRAHCAMWMHSMHAMDGFAMDAVHIHSNRCNRWLELYIQKAIASVERNAHSGNGYQNSVWMHKYSNAWKPCEKNTSTRVEVIIINHNTVWLWCRTRGIIILLNYILNGSGLINRIERDITAQESQTRYLVIFFLRNIVPNPSLRCISRQLLYNVDIGLRR